MLFDFVLDLNEFVKGFEVLFGHTLHTIAEKRFQINFFASNGNFFAGNGSQNLA